MFVQPSIAFLLDSSVPNWRSNEDWQLGVCEALQGRGIRTLLVFSRDIDAACRGRFESRGIGVASLDYSKGAIPYLRGLRRLITAHRITTAHVIFFDYFSAIPWLSRLSGVPHIVYEAHNSGAVKAQGWKKQLLRLRTRIATAPIRQFIAISDFVAAQLIAAGVPAERIQLRYLGIDTERFAPNAEARAVVRKQYGIAAGETVVSTISYLRPFKNTHVILEACGILRTQGVPLRLLIAGDGELRPQLEALGRTLGIADRVQWLGDITHPERLLQGSDVFVLASVGEAFGLVFAEAMACGIPAIGSRSGATPEVIQDGRTGLLATPLDATSFADAIGRLAQDPQLRSTMGANARAHALGRFRLERSVAETVAFYETALNGARLPATTNADSC